MARAGVWWWLLVAASLAASIVIDCDADGAVDSDDDVDYYHPVRSGHEDEVFALPGMDFEKNFRQFSGYLEADTATPRSKFFHYWLVESQSSPVFDPLVLWLNGGPGCSSVEGVLTESGPFRVHLNGSVTRNEYSWNDKLSILYIEGPAGVGFSYGAYDTNHTIDDDEMAKQYLTALRSFFAKHTKYHKRKLYIVGESYGATYAAVLSHLIVKEAKEEINLKGIALANGYTEADLVVKSVFFYAYWHGFLGDKQWANFSRGCCHNSVPDPSHCLVPLDVDIEKCSNTTRELGDLVLGSGLNTYNVFDDCHDVDDHPPNGKRRRIRTRMDAVRELLMDSMSAPSYCAFGDGARRRANKVAADDTCAASDYKRSTLLDGDVTSSSCPGSSSSSDPDSSKGSSSRSRGYGTQELPCWDGAPMENYLRRRDVLKTLHIPHKLPPFVTCATKDEVNYIKTIPCSPGQLTHLVKSMLDFGGNQEILIYYGDADIMCSFYSGRWLVERFGYGLSKDWSPWYLGNQVAGWYEQWYPITLATVKGAGHMVPQDKPAQSKFLIESWIFGPMNGNLSQPQTVNNKEAPEV